MSSTAISDVPPSEENSPAAAPLFFRGEPIAWEVVTTKKTKIIEGAFSDDEIEREGKQHFIQYRGQQYRRDGFMKAVFPEYKKYPYKVKFLTDDIFRLSSNQRAKLQYHILARRFPLVEVNERDKEDLKALCRAHKAETAQRWLHRMEWENGIEKMVSFGVAQEVGGRVSGVWCYSALISDARAAYFGIPMTWEQWLAPIRDELLRRRAEIQGERAPPSEQDELCESAIKMLSYQNGMYLTLPAEQMKTLKAWIYQCYFKGSTRFPYDGEINPAAYDFQIDFERDIEIVPADERKERMKQLNHENNAEHNKEMGRKRVSERFAGLQGDIWTTQEILSQGFTRAAVTNFVKHGLIRRIKNGFYERVLP